MKSKLLKIAAAVSAAALIAGGIYFLFHDDLAQKISYEKLKPFMPDITVPVSYTHLTLPTIA